MKKIKIKRVVKINGKVYHNLPFKCMTEVINFCNTPTKVCPFCDKSDIDLEHIDQCLNNPKHKDENI